jgi:hypothetical protein
MTCLINQHQTVPPFEKGGLGGIFAHSILATKIKSPSIPLLQRGKLMAAHELPFGDMELKGAL